MNIKSPEAFRTISEVSKDLSLPQHVLRFWETKFTQIKPIKRGGGKYFIGKYRVPNKKQPRLSNWYIW